jgi:hypothetical protein
MEETMWTVMVKGQVRDFIFGTIESAYTEARHLYGRTASVRESWYGEWDCGTPEIGSCWHDEDGNHHRRAKVAV